MLLSELVSEQSITRVRQSFVALRPLAILCGSSEFDLTGYILRIIIIT